jgi:hypothetical protein
MACVEELQKVKCFARPDLAQDDSVRAVPKGCLQKIADGDGLNAVLLAPRFEPHDVQLGQLEFGSILDHNEPLVVGNEPG